ncbi:MAG: glycoside hydrolase family 43 protein [Lactobacillaceae bacterium]|jgi:GH43 family beta-xylosidase|nr:glycoside hydrolase family 43 protein [Lactobacillaceae bacterium]
MKLDEINIRDPFILPFEGRYYLYGTRGYNAWEQPADLTTLGFDVYVSEDLLEWSAPIEVFSYSKAFPADQNFWAPEVHYYQGRFYMFATFICQGQRRGTYILAADHPTAWFEPHSEGAITPSDWECLDGTFYVDQTGTPYMIFCHEWKQIKDGTISSVQLTPDLTRAVSTPRTLVTASSPAWVRVEENRFVTDGPFVYTTKTGEVLLFWSSMKEDAYVEAIALAENGDINGNWLNAAEPFFAKDGGHGMVFTSFDGKLYFVLHQPNDREKEHPILFEITDEQLLSYF